MKGRKRVENGIRSVLIGSGLLFLGAAILFYGAEAAEGIRQGIRLCLSSVIPSL